MNYNRFIGKCIIALLFCIIGLSSCGVRNIIPANEIHYTTIDNSALTIEDSPRIDNGKIVSNSYDSVKNVCIFKFDKDVTEIGDSAFRDCSSLKSITIPPSVTEIGEDAFYGCSSLTSITVSKDNKVYDSREDCNAIIHTESNTLISGCENTTIPPSVTEIGKDAFRGCSSLTSISIPPSVTEIAKDAFSGCSNLTSISIPPSVTEIAKDAFSGCSSLTSITVSKDNKVYDSREDCNAIIHTESNTLIRGCENTIILPSVTEIGDSAFYGCSSLTSITIPPSVTEIGSSAFDGCSSLKSITIPPSVTEIGEDAFDGCSSLKSITIPPSVTEIGEDAFYGCSSLKSISIPESVTKIGEDAFYGCSSLTSISIPPSVTEIGGAAFSDCSSLKSISVSKDNKVYDSREDCNAIIHTKSNTLISGCKNTIIPLSVTKIGDWAFSGCYSLTSISIPPSVTEIGSSAFDGCSSLTSISIPPSVTEIGNDAFSGCSSLTSITIPPSVTEIGLDAFSDCSSLTSITVSKDNKVYDSREDCNAIIHTESNTLIRGCENTIIPPSVTRIGWNAFYGCSNLTSISIPSSVTEIGWSAFSGCSSLKSITVSKENKVYDSREDCNAIIHTESNTLIRGCKNTIISPSVKKIGSRAFSGCSNLTSITIPESVTKIEKRVFSGCSSLTSITVSKDNKVYDSREDCNAIIHTESNTLISGCKNTIIPPSVTEISEDAFWGCKSLTSITIPESVTKIGVCAFYGCSSLTEVRIPKDCYVYKDAFFKCPNVQIIRY